MEVADSVAPQLSSSSPAIGWALQSNTVFEGDAALEAVFGPGLGSQWASVTLPAFNTGSELSLRFRYRLEVGNGDCSAGRLTVTVNGQSVWQTCTKTGGWRSVNIPLDTNVDAGPDISIRLDTGNGLTAGSAAIDDLAIGGECVLECEDTCDDGDPCTQDVCIDGACVSEFIPQCCVSVLSCQDGDPCTQDSCTAQGCIHTAVPDCSLGACLYEGFEEDEELLVLTDGDGNPADLQAMVVEYGGGHGLLFSGGPSAQVNAPTVVIATFPPVLSSGQELTLRGRYTSTLSDCLWGTFSIQSDNGGSLAVESVCDGDGHFELNIPGTVLNETQPQRLKLRFEATNPAATLIVDDLRIQGGCQAVECAAAGDCPSVGCEIQTCDAGYRCQAIALSGCCETSSDCQVDACDVATCVDGQCINSPTTEMCDQACYQPNMASVFTTVSATDSTHVTWQLASDATYFQGAWAIADGASTAGDLKLGRIRVWDADTHIRFRYSFEVPSGCDDGALELWLGSTLLWQGCDSAALSWVTLPVPPVSNTEARRLKFRLRSAVSSAGTVTIDAFTVRGGCQPVECEVGADCDDGTACTDDCLGYACTHLSNPSNCDDGDACTYGDTCINGECSAIPLVCDDGNPCTDDVCEPSSGCAFLPNSAVCDDGEPCTAGDVCTGGLCNGTPIVCKDLTDCTTDGCTPGIGCEFDIKPFGTTCNDGGIEYGACVNGVCTAWEQSLIPGNSKVEGLSTRTKPVPLRAVGQTSAGAAVWTLGQATLETSSPTVSPNVASWYAADDSYVVGENGVLSSLSAPSTLAPTAITPPMALRDVASFGTTVFSAGVGYAHGTVQSNVRRCKATDGVLTGCQVMPVVKSPAQCGNQRPFHAYGVVALSSQSLLVAGTSFNNLDATAVVAEWNGNTVDTCDALGVYSGEVYSDGGASLRVNTLGLGRREVFRAIGQSADETVWTAGSGGMIYRRTAGVWYGFMPSDWPAGAAFHEAFEIRALHAEGDAVYFVGDGTGLSEPGCHQGFLVRAIREGDQWWVDHLTIFDWLKACGEDAYLGVGLRDVVIDGLTGDLLLGGFVPNNQATTGLLLRLRDASL